MKIPTPHIEATDRQQIASTVLMPGDPLRAKYIAETFLKDAKLFNSVRNILGYTGTYEGKQISVMASGMGMASIGIYSYELFAFYGVENIIRIGSCGAYTEALKIFDILLTQDVYSESTYASVQSGLQENVLQASKTLNQSIITAAEKHQTEIKIGRAHSSDVFYQQKNKAFEQVRDQHQCLAVEMEAFALFANANLLQKQATSLLTVSDHLVHHQSISAQERQIKLNEMIQLALRSTLEI